MAGRRPKIPKFVLKRLFMALESQLFKLDNILLFATISKIYVEKFQIFATNILLLYSIVKTL